MVEDDVMKKLAVLQYQNIEEFCEFYTINIHEIKDHPEYAKRIEEHHSDLEQLIAGYSQMAGLNKEISGLFGLCECENGFESAG